MSLPLADKKWTCSHCTYENWAASKKCIMCRTPKTPQYITDEVPQEQDIYKMAPLVSSELSPTHSGASYLNSSTDPKNKWACQACTYLNWPKANKCTQCLTIRPKAVPILTRDHNQPLSINVNVDQASAPGSNKNSPKNSPKGSPNSPEAAKEINNDKNRAIAASSHHHPSSSTTLKSQKWTCKACTYENWPKSNKCVICGVIKGKTYKNQNSGSPDASSSSSDSEQRKSHTPNSSKRRSPPASRPSSARSSDSGDIYQLGGATASPMIINSEKKDRTKSGDSQNNKSIIVSGSSGSSSNQGNSISSIRQIHTRIRDSEWLWLNACRGVVEGDVHAVEAYVASGSDPSRCLTVEECTILNRPSAFQAGYTLIHLAIRFQREDILTILLTATDVVKKTKKRVPSHIAPDLASEILRDVSIGIRQRKGDFPCYFLNDMASFALPAEIEDFPRPVKSQLFSELLDQHAQKELEEDEPVINWSLEITERLGSRLYALWNRTAGDCLLDSVLQAAWGVFDRDNTLRRALADSLVEGANMFYPRWKECEALQAESMQFSLDESQWQQDWSILLSLASQPGSSLEQVHIFALAHLLRRPIIVYGIKFVKSFRGENLGFARFQGVYLPLLWESSFCWKVPIALGYTRGHFSALVAMELDMVECAGAGANLDTSGDEQIAYLPLMDCEGGVLPIHFLPANEKGREKSLLKEWLECCVTDGGLLVAQQRIHKSSVLVKQMVDEWLDRYRRLSQMVHAKTTRNESTRNESSQPTKTKQSALSSDDESDDE